MEFKAAHIKKSIFRHLTIIIVIIVIIYGIACHHRHSPAVVLQTVPILCPTNKENWWDLLSPFKKTPNLKSDSACGPPSPQCVSATLVGEALQSMHQTIQKYYECRAKEVRMLKKYEAKMVQAQRKSLDDLFISCKRMMIGSKTVVTFFLIAGNRTLCKIHMKLCEEC